MKVKMVIEIKNRTVQFVYANVDVQYIIVDFDDLKKDMHPLSIPLESDAVEDPLYKCYAEDDPVQAEIRENLRRLNF